MGVNKNNIFKLLKNVLVLSDRQNNCLPHLDVFSVQYTNDILFW